MSRPFLALAAALGVVLLGTVVPAWGAGPDPVVAAGGTQAHNGPALTLVSQTPWVGPGQPMQVELRVARAQAASLDLQISVYDCLTSRSALAETVSGTAAGVVEAQDSVSVASLPIDSAGDVTITIPVDDGTTPVTGSGPVTAPLHCASGPSGVYPIGLTLSDGSGARTKAFTYLVYSAAPTGTEKLRLAWVVPLSLGPGAGADSADVDSLAGLLSLVSAHPGVAVTLEPTPAALSTLSGSTRARARDVLSTLSALSAQPGREMLAQGYVPVDANALVSASLPVELTDQVERAQQELAALHPSAATWVAQDPLSQATLAQLEHLGFTHVVLPASAVTQSGSQTLTATRTFTLPQGKGLPPLAGQADSALGTHLAAADGPDPALAAYQFLADLALVYFEQPNLQTVRGVIAVPPVGWSADPTFVSTVLGALQSDPVVQPVTIDSFFDTVPISTVSHRLATASSSGGGLPASSIHSTRARVDAYAGAVTGTGAAVARSLDDALLSAEDSRLRASQQAARVAAAGSALDGRLAAISIRTDTIRLTSTAAKVPITIINTAPYGVTGSLSVSGDKVEFPSSAQSPGAVCHNPSEQSTTSRSTFRCTATLNQSTNAVYIGMRARESGDFRLTITLTSPSGTLVLASSQVTVRSVSVSAVAIALSAAALSVLALWWGRTLMRGRPRRGAHGRRRQRPEKALPETPK